MSDLARLVSYAQAFELAHLCDDWSLIAPHFAPQAVHRVDAHGPLATHDTGRDAVVAGLAGSVHTIDRRFDARIAEIIDGPTRRDGGEWMRFRLTLCRAGLPDLAFEGDHLAVYDGDTMIRLDERVAPAACDEVAAYLARHDAALRPAGAPPTVPHDPALLARVGAAAMRSVVRLYGAAKSRQDIAAALAVCADRFTIETVCFGLESRDRADTAAQLAAFFHAFPDYGVTLDGLTSGGDTVTCWGTARMTFGGAFLGHAPTGKTATYPFFSVFELEGGLLRRERFFFDLATVCAQIGLPLAAVSDLLRQLRAAA